MTTQEFIDQYEKYIDTGFDDIELEVVDYIPFDKKCEICEAIIYDSTYDKDGDFNINSAYRNLLYRMTLINAYMNVDIDYNNITEEFDELEMRDAVSFLLGYIDESEIARFDEIMQCKLNDLYQNERSQAALARRN